jgi:23S rRNA (guanosine2251-2'-O)-methyltransferase
MKASSGALSRLPVARAVNLAQALDKVEERGIDIYGAALTEGSESVYETELHGPAVLVLGNEESGIRQGIMKRCQKKIHIPFRREFDSLNVAQAGAIIVSEFARKITPE